MKYLLRLAVAILAFAIGVAISPTHFYWESVACGPRGSTTSYRSSYFIRTSRSYIYYESEAEASEAFKKKLGEAITIYDVSPKVSHGVLIEQHAVGLFYDQGNDDFYVVSFWRDGQWVHGVSSRSYNHVKDLENQVFAGQ